MLYSVKWLYSGKNCCNRAKDVEFRENCFSGAKLLYSEKSGCIRVKWL